MTRAEFLQTSTQIGLKSRPLVLPYLPTPLLTDVQILTADGIAATQHTARLNAVDEMRAQLRAADVPQAQLVVPEQTVGSIVSHTA